MTFATAVYHCGTMLSMVARLPLFAQLSHTYTAFTVAADNAFELRVPHRTTEHGGTPGAPWLVSTSLWFRFLRHIPMDGSISLRDLKQQAALPPNEFKMWMTRFESWWGYLRIDLATKNVSSTRGGRLALGAWPNVLAETEATWSKQLGTTLTRAIAALTAEIEKANTLSPCLPSLNHGMYITPERDVPMPATSPLNTSLPAQLAKLLNAFALDYERETFQALIVSANVLRIIPAEGVAIRTLAPTAGIAKGAMINALKLVLSSGAVEPHATTASKGSALRRTSKGDNLHALYEETVSAIEARWRAQFGAEFINQIQKALPTEEKLLAAIKPQTGNWRANVPAPTHLPWFPMILHRGGFPDGS
jgi:hypothetical protein